MSGQDFDAGGVEGPDGVAPLVSEAADDLSAEADGFSAAASEVGVDDGFS